MDILLEEVKDHESTLVKAGEDRVRMVNEMMTGINDTLTKLQKVAKKYKILDSGSKSQQLWTRFKWSLQNSDIDALRNKVPALHQ